MVEPQWVKLGLEIWLKLVLEEENKLNRKQIRGSTIEFNFKSFINSSEFLLNIQYLSLMWLTFC